MSVTGDLNALYKVAYANNVLDLVPAVSKIRDSISFVPSELQNGKHYEQPVVLTQEAGFTYSLDTQNAYDLNESIGMQMQSAIVNGADLVLDSTIGYNQAVRASHSKTSFKTGMSSKLENMIKSAKKREEISYLHGGTNIGEAAIQSVSIVNGMVAVVISTASWATGIWAGTENANVCFSQLSNNTAVDTLRSFRLAKVDVDSRTLYFAVGTAGTPGTLATLVTAIGAAALQIHFFGSVSGSAGTFAYAEMVGLKKQMTNTGLSFGIDAAIYDLWRGNSVITSGQFSVGKLLAAISKPVQRGLESDVCCYLNPATWADLAASLASLRRFDGSYSKKKSTSGSEELEFVGQNGTIKIVSYSIVKEGESFIFPEDHVMRLGARQLGLADPTKAGEEEIFFTIPGKAGIGVRCYANEAIFLETPAQAVYISGIVNSAP